MKKAIDIIMTSVLAAVTLSVTAVGLIGMKHSEEDKLCVGLDAVVTDYPQTRFIDSKGVRAVLDRDFGGYVNKPLNSIDTDLAEKVLLKQGFIKECSVWTTADGILHAKVSQRPPVLKLETGNGLWYADEEGKCFKVAEDWCPGLPAISGQVRLNDVRWVEGVSDMGHWLRNNGKWNAEVSSIRSDEDGELELELRGRSEVFAFGQPEDIEAKFHRLGEYLEKVAPKGIEYTSISVKYKGQIICK